MLLTSSNTFILWAVMDLFFLASRFFFLIYLHSGIHFKVTDELSSLVGTEPCFFRRTRTWQHLPASATDCTLLVPASTSDSLLARRAPTSSSQHRSHASEQGTFFFFFFDYFILKLSNTNKIYQTNKQTKDRQLPLL